MVTSYAGERVLAERPLRRRAIAGLLAAIVLPIPLVSAYGLTLPLPGFVGRMAFALVPGSGAERSAASASSRGVTIARLPGETVSAAGNPAAAVVTFDGRAAVIGTHRPLWTPLSRTIAASPAAGATVVPATTTAFRGGAPLDGDKPAAGGSTAVTPTAGTSAVTPSAGGGTGSTSPGAGSNGGGLTRVPDDIVDGTAVPTPVGGTEAADGLTPVDPSGTATTPTTDPIPTVTDPVSTVTDTVPTVTDTVSTVTDTVSTVTDTVTTVTSGTLGGLLPPGSGTHRKTS